jgi:hypothetical protein
MELLDKIIKPMVLYSSKVWGQSLIEDDWVRINKV